MCSPFAKKPIEIADLDLNGTLQITILGLGTCQSSCGYKRKAAVVTKEGTLSVEESAIHIRSLIRHHANSKAHYGSICRIVGIDPNGTQKVTEAQMTRVSLLFNEVLGKDFPEIVE